MSESERIEFRQKLREGLDRSRYKLIKEKALHNETLVEGDYQGGTRYVSARALLKNVYNEDVEALLAGN